jgi:hypothetical protein
MRPVRVLLFHAEPAADAGPLVRSLADARLALARRQRDQWLAAGADTADVVAGPPDDLSFGERLRAVALGGAAVAGAGASTGGLVIAASGSMPLASVATLRRFVDMAAGPGGHALANNRYSADVAAISRTADLAGLPPLPSDNALPRWLEERAGVMVTDLGHLWRLGFDVDTPLDLMLLRYAGRGRGGHSPAGVPDGHSPAGVPGVPSALLGERLEALTAVLANRRAELLVAGRVSTSTLRFLQTGVACRVRALVEERGLRAASRLAQAAGPTPATSATRPPRSILGELLDRDGPESLARHVAVLADAAVIDSRVLMAHRFGAAESAWPAPEDRFASDLLDASAIADPWLRALTTSGAAGPTTAATSTTSTTDLPAPILLGGHTLVNGGLRLLAQRARSAAT